MLYPTGKIYRRLLTAVVVCYMAGLAQAQAPTLPGGNPGLELPPGGSSQKVNEFLGTLKPPTNFKALENGNNLKLVVPDIAASGPVHVGMSSTLPRTDALWLLTLEARPDGGSPQFLSVALEPSTQPEVNMVVNLYKTQHLLLVARAGGKYYGVHRQIKVGVPAGQSSSK
jgi:predicted secreted protein